MEKKIKRSDIDKIISNNFKSYLDEYSERWHVKEDVFIKAFREYLILSRYSCLPSHAARYFSDLCKLRYGYSHSEIQEIICRQANSIQKELNGEQPKDALSESETKVVIDYNAILFGKFKKGDINLF